MRPHKVQDSVNKESFFFYKLNRRLAHRDDIPSRNPQLRRLIEHLLPDIAYDYPGADGEYDLQRIEPEAAESKKEDGLVGLHLATTSDCVIGGVYGVSSHSRFGGSNTYEGSDMTPAAIVTEDRNGKHRGLPSGTLTAPRMSSVA